MMRALAAYPVLFVEMPAYHPSMSWGARNRPRLARLGFQRPVAEVLTGVFIHDWRCSSGRLGECPGGRAP